MGTVSTSLLSALKMIRLLTTSFSDSLIYNLSTHCAKSYFYVHIGVILVGAFHEATNLSLSQFLI